MVKKKTIAQLVENSVLASPPDLLFKIINSLDSELSSRQIGEIIGHDQSISAQVLKLSNSSFFGFKGNIKTLDRAINILGTKTVRNIAVTTLLFAHTNKVRLWNLDILNFWLHTFLVADITRELSQKVGLDGDEAYIAGLLHDIGKLVLYAQRQDKAPVFKKIHTEEDIFVYEEETWGIRSSEMSRMLLTKWNIPEDTVAAITGHDSIDEGTKLSAIIHVANELSSIVTDPNHKSVITYPVFKKFIDKLELNEQDFYRFSVQIPDIAERGKMIMKVMSKDKSPVTLKRRMINRATVITSENFSVSVCILKLLGITPEVFTVKELNAYNKDLKRKEELRRKQFEDEPEPPPPAPPEPRKKPGFFSRIFSHSKDKKEIETEHVTPEVKQINWNPLVIFENCKPVEIDRKNATVYQVMKDPAEITGNPLPFFFAHPDIETQ